MLLSHCGLDYNVELVSVQQGDWNEWPCPQMFCRPVRNCRLVEVVAWVHGPRVCQGCPYCLDGPSQDERSRGRRDLASGGATAQISQQGSLPIAQVLPSCNQQNCLFNFLMNAICPRITNKFLGCNAYT